MRKSHEAERCRPEADRRDTEPCAASRQRAAKQSGEHGKRRAGNQRVANQRCGAKRSPIVISG